MSGADRSARAMLVNGPVATSQTTTGDATGAPVGPVTTTTSEAVRPRAPKTMGGDGGVMVTVVASGLWLVMVNAAESLRTPDVITMLVVPFVTPVAVVVVPVAGVMLARIGARDSQASGRLVPTLSCEVPVNSCVPALVVIEATVGTIGKLA